MFELRTSNFELDIFVYHGIHVCVAAEEAARKGPMHDGRWILWPRRAFVSADQIVVWAQDDVANGKHPGPMPATLDDALAIIVETGTLTFQGEA